MAPATVSFCEARLCAAVVEPSNAWSSFGYVAVGLVLLASRRGRGSLLLGGVAIAEVAIGVGSFALHGTGTFVGELMDLAGMFLLSGLMLSYALGRARALSSATVLWLWAALVVGALSVVLVIRPAGIAIFAVQLTSAIAVELVLWRQGKSPHFPLFAQSLGCVVAAFTAWTLDFSRLVCAPDNHLVTGHAVWHVLNAIGIWRLFVFYAEGEATRAASAPTAAVAGARAAVA